MRKQEWKRGWKVTDKGRSWDDPEGCTAVRYAVGVETRPKLGNGPLAVFGTEAEARAWLQRFPNEPGTVHPCLYLPDRKAKGLWRQWEGFRAYKVLEELPEGTVLARAVVLVRKGGQGDAEG